MAAVITPSLEKAVDKIIERCAPKITLFVPLGLGKPTQLTNALYQRVKADPSLELVIFTALTLERPSAGKGLQGAYLGPIFDRLFDGYVGADYIADIRAKRIPSNITVHEFFVKSGGFINVDSVQQNYISSNYTHAARDALKNGINVIAQVIAVDGDNREQVSLSCNPEITLNAIAHAPDQDRPMLIGQVHTDLPYMINDAETDINTFDLVLDNPELSTRLFGTPSMPVTMNDYMIGLHASSLVKDGGTLQIGIGALGDAVAYALKFRHEHNQAYRETQKLMQMPERFGEVLNTCGGNDTFNKGLYGSSEMFVDGFLYLIKSGILKRHVYQDIRLQEWANNHQDVDRSDGPIRLTPAIFEQWIRDGVIDQTLTPDNVNRLHTLGILNDDCQWCNDGLQVGSQHWPSASLDNPDLIESICKTGLGTELNSFYMHGGFFLGPNNFYEELCELSDKEMKGINMTDIRYMNHLYDNEMLKRAQRQDGRFINTAFLVSIMGAATSDALENGQAVSGVGGQYNFVSQAHELDNGRSILMLKATREKNGVVSSNIVTHYGHTTIPRHLRDIYITEYGIADVRGLSDSDVIKAMINIADSRFQEELLDAAKGNGKVERNYQIPDIHRQNTPEKLQAIWQKVNGNQEFPAFPFGTDFTELEQKLGGALKRLAAQKDSKISLIKLALKGRAYKGDAHQPYLERMKLTSPQGFAKKVERWAFIGALEEAQLI